ncbi:Kinesin-like protein KIF13B [Durusdinium trenchii]|uniref:Kinesin-like protein KIF13B n=1 Tax=Durusdinium trenchii TaxID=1381693 RepID=A0ABP0ID10_9DINO
MGIRTRCDMLTHSHKLRHAVKDVRTKYAQKFCCEWTRLTVVKPVERVFQDSPNSEDHQFSSNMGGQTFLQARQRVAPDARSLVSVSCACAGARQWEAAWSCLQDTGKTGMPAALAVPPLDAAHAQLAAQLEFFLALEGGPGVFSSNPLTASEAQDVFCGSIRWYLGRSISSRLQDILQISGMDLHGGWSASPSNGCTESGWKGDYSIFGGHQKILSVEIGPEKTTFTWSPEVASQAKQLNEQTKLGTWMRMEGPQLNQDLADFFCSPGWHASASLGSGRLVTNACSFWSSLTSRCPALSAEPIDPESLPESAVTAVGLVDSAAEARLPDPFREVHLGEYWVKGHLFLAVKIRPTSTVFEWNPEMVAREPWMEQCKDRTEGFRKFVNQCRGVPMTAKRSKKDNKLRDWAFYAHRAEKKRGDADYFALKREKNKPLSRESIKACARAIILVVAGLHAKGLVHLARVPSPIQSRRPASLGFSEVRMATIWERDLKPENLMMFNGRLKLIDVDGCVPIDSEVSINDSSISFSPCYCAPEWARFLIDEAENKIIARPHLDVWSIGITLCELVTLDAILKPMYGNFLRNGHSHREAGFLFMDWLGHITRAPVPKSIERFDKDFHKLIVEGLLVCDHLKRKSLAQCLSDPYIYESSASATHQELHEGEKVQRQHRHRFEDTSSKAPLYKGTLFKLNTDGNADEPAHWLKRDMWVACDGSLCYFSIKENKRLVLLDGVKLAGAKVENLSCKARDFAFKLDCINSDDHEQDICMCFSAESEAEYQLLDPEGLTKRCGCDTRKWRSLLSQATNLDGAMQTIRLGGVVADELKQFRLAVKNRRMKVGEDTKDGRNVRGPAGDQFAPVFKAKLWKVKAEGDRKKAEDWFEREMWIAKNGSLVYWSKKEDRELVYYTADDIANAKFIFLEKDDATHPWAFQVQLAPNSGVEFAPGEFAAESEALRDRTLDGRPLPGGHLKGWRKGPGCDCGRRVQEEAIWPELATDLEL